MKYYYMFIGDSVEQMNQTARRFIVESDFHWNAECPAVGKVVVKNSQCPHILGDKSALWHNPCLEHDCFSCFVSVPKYFAEEAIQKGEISIEL